MPRKLAIAGHLHGIMWYQGASQDGVNRHFDPLWISSDYTVRVFKFKSGECLDITALLTLLHNLQKLNMSISSLQEESKVLDPKVPLSIELEPLSWPKQGLRKA